ncbi:MAG: MxaK protein [Caldimonas sp.]
MGLATRGRTRSAFAGVALLLMAAAVDGVHLWRMEQSNATIVAGQVAPDTPEDAPREVRFAQALAESARGADEAALRRYRALQDDSPLGLAARFNSANVLMRQAVIARSGIQPAKAIPLIELAKEMYREVLRTDPQHWQARYNLERAQRLLPEPGELEVAPPDSQRNAERAATTMRGYSPGLP